MSKTISKEDINELLNIAVDNFLKSNRSEKEKNKLKELKPILFFKRSLKTTLGQASLVHSRNTERFLLNLTPSMPRIKTEGKLCWAVIELNPLLIFEARKEVFETISHELAHLLDFVSVGMYYDRKTHLMHSSGWKEVHQAMGGRGDVHGDLFANLNRLNKQYIERKINELYK